MPKAWPNRIKSPHLQIADMARKGYIVNINYRPSDDTYAVKTYGIDYPFRIFIHTRLSKAIDMAYQDTRSYANTEKI